jgi:hypothetical protein
VNAGLQRLTDKSSARAVVPGARGVLQRKCDCGHHTIAGGECEDCKNKHARLQRYVEGSATTGTAPSIVHDALRSPGRPLEPAARAYFEPRFGRDLSRVRVHTDEMAAESARAVNALAYTVGSEVVFGRGRYSPATGAGKKLLAHELAHTIQQNGATRPDEDDLRVGAVDTTAEREAARAAEALVSNEGSVVSPYSAPGIVQRQVAGGANPSAGGAVSPPQKSESAPPTRDFINFHVGNFGRFDATLEPRGKPPGGKTPGFLCALTTTMKVKFDFDNSKGKWPPGRPAHWQKEFAEMVAKHWSTKYLLLPAKPCPGEGCAMTAVYVKVEPVTSGEHHEVKVFYKNPNDARSNAGVPGASVGEFYESDVRPHGGILPREQTTGAHEAGHWLGLQHIFCDSNSIFCYGITSGQSDDVMGRGEYVSGRDYEPFLKVMRDATHCDWKTDREGGSRQGSMALAFGILGAGAGALLGAATGAGAGGIIGLAALFGGVGAIEGFLLGDLR